MTRSALAVLALVGLACGACTAANAADMPIKAPASKVVVSDWSGFYLGANAGFGFGDSDVTTTTVFSPTGYFAAASVPQIAAVVADTVSVHGALGGLVAGYNAQSGTLVYGIELEVDASGLKGDRGAGSMYVVAPPTAFSISETTKAKSLTTLRGRVGRATGRTFWFGTAGLAMASIRIEDTFTDTFATAAEGVSTSKSKLGWALGGGFEVAMPGRWSFKAQYLHMDFRKATADGGTLTAFTPAIAYPSNTFSHSANLKAEVVAFGINHRF